MADGQGQPPPPTKPSLKATSSKFKIVKIVERNKYFYKEKIDETSKIFVRVFTCIWFVVVFFMMRVCVS